MSYEKLVARAKEINMEISELEALLENMTDEQSARLDELLEEGHTISISLEAEEARQAKVNRIREAASKPENLERGTPEKRTLPVPGVESSDPYDAEMRASIWEPRKQTAELRSRAVKATEMALDEKRVSTESADRIDSLLRRYDDKHGSIAKRILATGSDAYRSAFSKFVSNPTGYQMMLTAEEQTAVARAMSLTDASGGFAIPFTLDGTLILTSDVAANPWRGIARVEPITTDTWNGLSSNAVSGGYAAEASEVDDDTSTFAQPSVPVHRGDAFVPASFEIVGDYPNLEAQLGQLFAEAKDTAEAAAFATGSGTNEPTGIVTALTGGAQEISSATTDVFAAEDVYSVHQTLQNRHRSRSTWVANIAIHNDIRQFGTSDPNFTVDFTAAAIPTLLGRPIVESSDMDGTVTALSDNYVLILGNFNNYVIAERVGAQLEFVPHLFDTNANRPSGQRGFLYWWRNGGDSVNDSAFVMLNVT